MELIFIIAHISLMTVKLTYKYLIVYILNVNLYLLNMRKENALRLSGTYHPCWNTFRK